MKSDKFGPLPPPFDRLPPGSHHSVALSAGAVLFHQGEATHAMFIVAKGQVDLVRHTEHGTEVLLFRALSGDTLAEAALFSERFHCTATARKAARVIAVNRQAIRDAIEADGAFALDLSARLARQVQTYRRRIEVSAMRRAEDRIMAILDDGWKGQRIVDLAREATLSPEATYRALARLAQAGRVARIGRGQFVART